MFYVVQSDPLVPPGLYGEHLQQRKIPAQLLRLDRGASLPSVDAVRGTLILGGNMSVDDGDRFPYLLTLQQWLRDLTAQQVPLLGICLGGQLLAHALGGRVNRDSCGEVGIGQVELTEAGRHDPLFKGLSTTINSLQWHNDSFESPEEAQLLASSPVCPGQAFRYPPCSYGLQFHPEADTAIVDSWNKRARLDETIPADFSRCQQQMREPALRLLDNFLSLCGYEQPFL